MKHDDTERLLHEYAPHVKYRYVQDLPVEKVLISDRDLDNIRPAGVNQDTVVQYALAMEQGREFPAIVVYETKHGYLPLGGIHRLSAAQLAERATLSAYVMDLDEKKDARTTELLQRVLNSAHGLPPDREERILQAVRLVTSIGFTAEDAARAQGIKPHMLLNRMNAMKMRDVLLSMGAPAPDQETSLLEFFRIRNRFGPADGRLTAEVKALLQGTADIARRAHLNSNQLKELSAQMRSASTNEEAQAVLNRWAAEHRDTPATPGGGRKASPTKQLMLSLSKFERRLKPELFTTTTQHELGRIIKQMEAFVRAMQARIADLKLRLSKMSTDDAAAGKKLHRRRR